jgi:hypothetical protein
LTFVIKKVKSQKNKNKSKKNKNMKKIILTTIILLVVFVSQAQITDIKIDSTITIDRIYVGSLSGTLFSTDSLHASGFTNIRFGVMGTYKPTSWISFSGWGMLQADNSGNFLSSQPVWMTLNPTKKLTLQLGSMPTLPTEQRPHAVSPGEQFETWTESQIPGIAPGVKLKYDFTSNFQFATGIAVRGNMPEYSARLTYNKFQVSGWYSTVDSTSGVAATVDFKKVYSTMVYKPNQTVANKLVVTVSKKNNLSFYSDMGYNFQEKKLVRGEWGLLKGFKGDWLKGLWGIGYRHEAKAIVPYLFVHL